MNILLPFNKSAEVSFNMDIAGTSAKPSSVQLSLEKGSTVLAFKAQDYGAGTWKTTISEASSVFGAGDLNYSINVLINGRLITPFKGTATIQNDDSIKITSTDLAAITTESVKAAAPNVAVVEQIAETKITQTAKPKVPKAEKAEVKPVVEEKIEQISKPAVLPLLKTIESSTKADTVKTNVVAESKKKPVQIVTEQPFSISKIRVFYK